MTGGCGVQGGCYTTSGKEELQLWSNLRTSEKYGCQCTEDLAVWLESMTNLHSLKKRNCTNIRVLVSVFGQGLGDSPGHGKPRPGQLETIFLVQNVVVWF